jgi:hypothetical protein
MATLAAAHFSGDQRFYSRMAIGISVFILFGFMQFAARGFVDYRAAPLWVHLHGVVFVSWLGVFVTQNLLAERGAIAVHRKLGWAGVVLAIGMVLMGSFTAIRALDLHRQPPFFEPPYFLALTHVGLTFFIAAVTAAIVTRRQTEWHRRLMLIATVLITEPAFGRLVPIPLLGAEGGETLVAVLQIGILAIAMLHDRRHRGAVHPALWWGVGLIVAMHLSVSLFSRFPPVIAMAQSLAA